MKRSVEVKRIPKTNVTDFVVIERFDTDIETKEPSFENNNVKGFPVVHQMSVEDIEPPQIWKKQWDSKLAFTGVSEEKSPKTESVEYYFDQNGELLELKNIGEEAIKLRDIILLVRSTVASQRNIHIQILTKIITKSLNNEYKDSKGIVIPIFNVLLSDYKLILLTRMSLDDQNQGVLYNALKLLHAIFNLKSNLIKDWYGYHRSLSVGLDYLCYSNLISPVDANSSNVATDSDISNSDIIVGLDIMGIFSRLRYVLEVVKVPSFVDYVLDILLYCSKHSTEISSSIIKCPRLIKVLISEFFDIELNLLKNNFADVYPYKYPNSKAINLISILCQSSVDNYNFIKDLYFIPKIIEILKWSFNVIENSSNNNDFLLYINDIQREILFFIQVIGYYKYPLQNLDLDQMLCNYVVQNKVNDSTLPYFLRTLAILVPETKSQDVIVQLCGYISKSTVSSSSTDLNDLFKTRCLLELINTILFKDIHYKDLFANFFNDNLLLSNLLSLYSIPTIHLLEYNFIALPCDMLAFFSANHTDLLSKLCIADSLTFLVKIMHTYYSLNTDLIHQKLSDLEFNKDFSIDPVLKFILRPFTMFKCICLNIVVNDTPNLCSQYYDTCIGVIPEISSCDKHLLHALFTCVLFNKSLILKFSQNFNGSNLVLLEKFYNRYTNLDTSDDLSALFSTVSFDIPVKDKLFTSINSQQLLLSYDWMLLPLSIFARKDLPTSSSLVNLISASAEYLLLLEERQFANVKSLHISIKLSHYLQFFLVNSDIFFEMPLENQLIKLLEYWFNSYQISITTSSITTNLISEVIDHYLSCSYGNQFFGHTFYIFLVMELDPSYRKQIYNALSDMLNLIKPSLNMPSSLFLLPKESSFDIILLQSSLLVSDSVVKEKNPFLYWLFIDHISSFISPNNNFSLWLKHQVKDCLQNNLFILNEIENYNVNKHNTS